MNSIEARLEIQELANIFLRSILSFQKEKDLPIKSLETLSELIKISSSCNNNQKRAEADKQLYEIKNMTPTKLHLMDLFHIIFYTRNDDIKLIEHIFPYTTNYIQNMSKYSTIETNEFIDLLAGIISCIVDKDHDLKFKSQLSLGIEYLLVSHMESS